MAELKLCPFCGGQAYTYTATSVKDGVKSYVWLVHCKDCKLNYPAVEKCYTEEEAVALWNKRWYEEEYKELLEYKHMYENLCR